MDAISIRGAPSPKMIPIVTQMSSPSGVEKKLCPSTARLATRKLPSNDCLPRSGACVGDQTRVEHTF